MSSVDKFGRPLKDDPAASSRTSSAIVEGLQLDKDKQFNARDKRIKRVATPVHPMDAVNEEWVLARLEEVEVNHEALINQARSDVIDELSTLISAANNRIEALEVNTQAYFDQSHIDISGASRSQENPLKAAETRRETPVVSEDGYNHYVSAKKRRR